MTRTKKSRITSKHQITIPQTFFSAFSNADEVEFYRNDGHICIRPVSKCEDELYNTTVSGHPVLAEPVWNLPADPDAGQDEIADQFEEAWT